MFATFMIWKGQVDSLRNTITNMQARTHAIREHFILFFHMDFR